MRNLLQPGLKVLERCPGRNRAVKQGRREKQRIREEYGIATSEEVDVKTLPERLRKEVVAAKSPILLPMNVTAWTRLTMDSA